MKGKNIFLIINAILLFNCSNNALIKTATGKYIQGEIVGGDGENVYVKTFAKTKPIKKNGILMIDHPGNGLAVGGGILSAYGILNIAVGSQKCADNEPAFCVGVFLPAAIGIPMFIKGLTTWKKSKLNLLKPYYSGKSTYILPNYAHFNNTNKFGLVFIKQF